MNSVMKPRVPDTVKVDATVSSAWTAFLENVRRSPTPGVLLSLDPGETTGWAVFHEGRLTQVGQANISQLGYSWFDRTVLWWEPDAIVCENYKVYAHRAKQHVGSEVLTIRYIGALELICERDNIPITFQMAYQAKGFATDTKLKQWGLYQVAAPHANDAIRHAVYYLLFHTGKGQRGDQGR